MSRSRRLLYIAAMLIGAVFVLVYRGPLWPYVRGYMGDWLIVQFIYMIGRLWIPDRWRYWLAGGVFLLGILTEIIQYFGAASIPRNAITELTIGSTFDPLDIITYAVGIMTVLLLERLLSRPKHAD
jgi:hypothetical protein